MKHTINFQRTQCVLGTWHLENSLFELPMLRFVLIQ